MDVSIIIPVYNKVKYVENLLRHIQSQTFNSFECLLIDDGSTDGSSDICDWFSTSDNRFRVFHIQNNGVSHARNVGLNNARGEYITFIDADDDVSLDYIEKLYNAIVETKADLVISAHMTRNKDGVERKVVYPFDERIHSMSEILPSMAMTQVKCGVFGWCWSKIVSRSIVRNERFDESLSLAEDFAFYLKLYPRIETVYFVNGYGYYYQLGADNSTAIIPDDKIDYEAQIRVNMLFRDFLISKESYEGDNRLVVESKLRDYAFFSLLHAPLNEMGNVYDRILKQTRLIDFSTEEHNLLKRNVFRGLECNRKWQAVIPLKIYRYLRRILKGH